MEVAAARDEKYGRTYLQQARLSGVAVTKVAASKVAGWANIEKVLREDDAGFVDNSAEKWAWLEQPLRTEVREDSQRFLQIERLAERFRTKALVGQEQAKQDSGLVALQASMWT